MAIKVEVAGSKGDNFGNPSVYGKVYEVKGKAKESGYNTGTYGNYGIRRMVDGQGRPVVVHGPKNEVYDPKMIANLGLTEASSGGGGGKKVKFNPQVDVEYDRYQNMTSSERIAELENRLVLKPKFEEGEGEAGMLSRTKGLK